MEPWQDLTHYAGFDWAKDHHSIVIVDREGKIVADFEFDRPTLSKAGQAVAASGTQSVCATPP